MFGVTTWTLPVRGEEALRWASEAGFSTVHLDSQDWTSQTDLTSIAEAAQRYGLSLGALAVNHFAQRGYTDMAASRSAVEVGVDVAAQLDVGYLYLAAFGTAEIRNVRDLEGMVQLLAFALELTESTGTIVALESALPAADLRRIFEAVNDPRLRLLFDTQNPSFFGHDSPQAASELADLIGSFVHVKDGTGALGNARIGTGESNLRRTLEAVMRGGFKGTYVLENDYTSLTQDVARLDQQLLLQLMEQNLVEEPLPARL